MQNYYHPFSSFGTCWVVFCFCNEIAMFFYFISNVLQSKFTQHSNKFIQNSNWNLQQYHRKSNLVSIPATLQMQGFRTSMKTCECRGFCDCFNFVYIHQFLHQLISFFTFSELLIQPLPKKYFCHKFLFAKWMDSYVVASYCSYVYVKHN